MNGTPNSSIKLTCFWPERAHRAMETGNDREPDVCPITIHDDNWLF